MNAKIIKPLAGELLDDQMRLAIVTTDYAELERVLNSRSDPAAVFDTWQFFCGRMFLQEMGKNPSRN